MRKAKMKNDIKKACETFKNSSFTAYEVYYSMMSNPKKLGGSRRNFPSYAEIKQILPRADFVEKIESEESKNKNAVYRNRGIKC